MSRLACESMSISKEAREKIAIRQRQSNIKSPHPPFIKGGERGILDTDNFICYTASI